MSWLDTVTGIADAILDSFFVVDTERTILHYNKAFAALMPKGVARNLRGKKCYDVLRLEICKERCIAKQCWQERGATQLEGITGHAARSGNILTFNLSAVPIYDEGGVLAGAVEVQRNMTEELELQTRYQELKEGVEREREELKETLRGRTRALLETSQRLQQVQQELLEFRRGRIV
ncbi:MAG: PAS domain-containing protein [Deltaproteobacteria bacterium]|nr:PAS domain-containing protein [Deltaproteobacteria bacterium]